MCQRAHAAAAGLGSPELCTSASEHGCDSREMEEDGGRWTVSNWRFRVCQLTDFDACWALQETATMESKTSNFGHLRTSGLRREKSELCCCFCRPRELPGLSHHVTPHHPARAGSTGGCCCCTRDLGALAAVEVLGQSDHEKRKRREAVTQPLPGASSGEKHTVSSCKDPSFSLIPQLQRQALPIYETLVPSAPSPESIVGFQSACLGPPLSLFSSLVCISTASVRRVAPL